MKKVLCAVLVSFPFCPDGSGKTSEYAVAGKTAEIPEDLVEGLVRAKLIERIDIDPADMSREQLVEAAAVLQREALESASDEELRSAISFMRAAKTPVSVGSYKVAPPAEIEGLPADLAAWSDDDKLAFMAWFETLPAGPGRIYMFVNAAAGEAFRLLRDTGSIDVETKVEPPLEIGAPAPLANETLAAAAGDESVSGPSGDDTLGGPGDDSIAGGAAEDVASKSRKRG